MKNDRADYILQELDKKGSVKVKELSKQLQCSEVTIRNDVQKLEERGLLRRTHGGAVRVKEQLMLSIDPGNIYKNVEQKQRIARQALIYIKDQDTIILDDSSVNYYLALLLKKENSLHLVVITNSFAVAGVLNDCVHITLFMIGGQLGGKLPAAMGEIAQETIRKFRADKAFISAHGISFDAGITSIGSPQMQVKRAILDVVDEVYVLVDSSKFGGGYVMVVCPLDRVSRIITDTDLAEEFIQAAQDTGVPLDVV